MESCDFYSKGVFCKTLRFQFSIDPIVRSFKKIIDPPIQSNDGICSDILIFSRMFLEFYLRILIKFEGHFRNLRLITPYGPFLVSSLFSYFCQIGFRINFILGSHGWESGPVESIPSKS